MGQRRYPGATPFRSDQSGIFYGRDRDIKKMLTLIQVESRVLLYSKSGLGKTSLIEAGVIPRLPQTYVPISIRFYAYNDEYASPVERVKIALEKVIGKFDDLPDTILDHFDNDKKIEPSLWYYFKKLQLAGLAKDEEGTKKTYLLVFDQFEELFSYPKEVIEDFKNQFYELTELNVPENFTARIASTLRNNPGLLSREKISELHKNIALKAVFAIRSDRLSLLNQLSDKIRDIQNIFYEIKALDENQARDAVINPARDDNPVFESKPYVFHKDAINKIIDELTDGGKQNIETTQLQIVCHRIEEIADDKSKTPGNQSTVEIEVEDLPEFKNIFLNFYNDSINKLPTEDRHNANRLIEDELIRSKQRISLDENICKEYIDEHQLKALVDTHLLRAEQNSFGRFSFELSHDTLIEPILESQKKYKDEQEKIALKKEQEEEHRIFLEKQEHREKERQKKLRIQRVISLIVTLFLLVSVGLVFLAFSSNRIAQEQKTKAIISQQKAVNYFITNTKQDIQKSKDNALNLIGDNDYAGAINNFEKAKQVIYSLSADSILSNEKSKNKDVAGGVFSFFQRIISSVDNEKNTVVSVESFNDSIIQTISRIKRDTIKINNSIIKVREKIDADAIIGQYKNRAMALRKSLKYREALQVYNEALNKDKDRNDVIKEYNSTLAEATVAYQSLVAFYQDEVKNKDKAAWAASRLLDFQNMKPKEER